MVFGTASCLSDWFFCFGNGGMEGRGDCWGGMEGKEGI